MFGRTSATATAPSSSPASAQGGHRAAGALRSEFDQGQGPAAMSEVAALAGDLVGLYQQAKIDERTVLRALGALVLHDEDGTQWCVGAGTLRWYRRLPGGVWRVATPDEHISPALTAAAAAAQGAALACLGIEPNQVELAAATTLEPHAAAAPAAPDLEAAAAPEVLSLLSFDDSGAGDDLTLGGEAGGYGD